MSTCHPPRALTFLTQVREYWDNAGDRFPILVGSPYQWLKAIETNELLIVHASIDSALNSASVLYVCQIRQRIPNSQITY